eukprot:1160101-Pelagomonas_calceolata.AAC.5
MAALLQGPPASLEAEIAAPFVTEPPPVQETPPTPFSKEQIADYARQRGGPLLVAVPNRASGCACMPCLHAAPCSKLLYKVACAPTHLSNTDAGIP